MRAQARGPLTLGNRRFSRPLNLRPHLNLDNVVLDGVNHQITDGVQAELPHDVAAMSLDCLRAQVQERSNFLGTLSLSQKLSDFALPDGQRWQVRRFVP